MSDCHSRTEQKRRRDWMLMITAIIIIIGYGGYYALQALGIEIAYVNDFATAIVDLVHKMWWGVLLGMVAVGVISRLPQQAIIALMGSKRRLGGIIRAVIGGILLDICSHGILLIGMQLYKRGASLGQTMAFLIASPWNSLSFTLILFALIGVPWTLAVIGASMVIAAVSGLIFEALVARGVLPPNPAQIAIKTQQAKAKSDATASDKQSLGALLKSIWRWPPRAASLGTFMRDTWAESRMVIRWIGLGLVIAAVIRTAINVDTFQVLFGPSLLGIGLTLLLATILEVCSEGSAPLAADMFTRASAPGNGFSFLMAGVATDYTEMVSLKEATGRWKISLFLPLVTLPQIIAVAFLFNA